MLTLALLSLLPAQEPAVSLALDRDSITVGDSTIVAWSLPGATGAVLLPFGAVPAAGRRTVRPRSTTTYILTATTPTGPVTRAVTVGVRSGAKGGGVPDRAEFSGPYRFRFAATERQALLLRLMAALQDSLHHSVRPTLEPDSGIVLETNRVLRPELVGADERRIGNRRGALRVTIPAHPAGAAFDYTVETCVEYQRRAERTWRPERDTELQHRVAEQLRHLVGPGP